MTNIASENAGGPAAPEAGHSRRYVVIFVWLAVLTAFEVLVTKLPLPQASIATLLIVSALGKAVLVALFFMHLQVERFVILFMVIFSLALAAVFTLGLFPDIVMGKLRLP